MATPVELVAEGKSKTTRDRSKLANDYGKPYPCYGEICGAVWICFNKLGVCCLPANKCMINVCLSTFAWNKTFNVRQDFFFLFFFKSWPTFLNFIVCFGKCDYICNMCYLILILSRIKIQISVLILKFLGMCSEAGTK